MSSGSVFCLARCVSGAWHDQPSFGKVAVTSCSSGHRRRAGQEAGTPARRLAAARSGEPAGSLSWQGTGPCGEAVWWAPEWPHAQLLLFAHLNERKRLKTHFLTCKTVLWFQRKLLNLFSPFVSLNVINLCSVWTRGDGTWPVSENVFALVSSFLEPTYFLGNCTCSVNESLQINGFTVPSYFVWLRI